MRRLRCKYSLSGLYRQDHSNTSIAIRSGDVIGAVVPFPRTSSGKYLNGFDFVSSLTSSFSITFFRTICQMIHSLPKLPKSVNFAASCKSKTRRPKHIRFSLRFLISFSLPLIVPTQLSISTPPRAPRCDLMKLQINKCRLLSSA